MTALQDQLKDHFAAFVSNITPVTGVHDLSDVLFDVSRRGPLVDIEFGRADNSRPDPRPSSSTTAEACVVSTTAKSKRSKTAEHRPPRRKRRYQHDDVEGGDLFSGFGGLTEGMRRAGVTTIVCANHNAYKVEIHEANNPEADHFVCDLVDPDHGDYLSPKELPKVDWLSAGISCVHHSQANAQKAVAEGNSLFTYNDPDYEARVTKSERDRATAICVMQYAEEHHPRIILVECTTELVAWGPRIPGTKIGDGSTYQWWLAEIHKLGYRSKTMYLNSQFFGVPQSRDRIYIAFWDKRLRAPDLEHRPVGWCRRCDKQTETVWAWKTRIPRSGRVAYGKQYHYVCPTCASTVVPTMTPSINALDLSNLGTRLGDRTKPLVPASMARAQRCLEKFADFPAVLMPAKNLRGVEKHPWQPMATQTSQQETAILSTGALFAVAGNTFERAGSDCRSRTFEQPLPTQTATESLGMVTPPIAMAIDNYQGAPRSPGDPLPTQAASETMAVVSALMPNRTHGTPRGTDDPMQTVVAGAGSGGMAVLSAGVIPYRANTIPTTHGEPMPTITSEQFPGMLTAAGWYKQNGGATDTAPHPLSDPLGTITAVDTTALLMAEWRERLADITLDECFYRMMFHWEIGRGCGFDPPFRDDPGTFIVWGTARDIVDGYGNAVSPQVGEFISSRLMVIL